MNLLCVAFIGVAAAFNVGRMGSVRTSRAFLEMAKKSVGDLSDSELKGKRVFVRADFNVPLEKGVITDDTRIRGAIPTIKYLTSKGKLYQTYTSHDTTVTSHKK